MSELLILPDEYQGIPIPESLRKGEYSGFIPRHVDRLVAYYDRPDLDGVRVEREGVRSLVADSGFFAKLMESRVPRKDGSPYLSHTTAVADDLINDAFEFGVRYHPAVFRIAYGHDHKEDLPEVLWQKVVARFGRISREIKGISALSKVKSSAVNRLARIDQDMFVAGPLMRTFAGDFICIRIKGADVKHNTLTLEHMSARQQRNTAMRNRRIMAPLMDEANLFSLKHLIDDWSVMYLDPAGYAYAKALYEYVARADDLLRDEFERSLPDLAGGRLRMVYFESPHIGSVYDAIGFQKASIGGNGHTDLIRSPFEFYHPKFTLVAANGGRKQFLDRFVPEECRVEKYDRETIVHDYPLPLGLRGTVSVIDEEFLWAKTPITVLEASQMPENQRAARKLRTRMRQAINSQNNGDQVEFARAFTESVGKKAKRVFVTYNSKPYRVLVGQKATTLDVMAAVLEQHELDRVSAVIHKEREVYDLTQILPDNSRLRLSLSDEAQGLMSIGMIGEHLTPPARDFVREKLARKFAAGRLTEMERSEVVGHGVKRLDRQLRRHFDVPEGVAERFDDVVREFAASQGQRYEDLMIFYGLCTERFVMHEITEKFISFVRNEIGIDTIDTVNIKSS